MMWLSGLGAKLAAGLAVILALIAAVAGVFFKGRSKGKEEEHAVAEAAKTKDDLAVAKDSLEAVKERNEADTTVAALPADDVTKQLQDDWTRP